MTHTRVTTGKPVTIFQANSLSDLDEHGVTAQESLSGDFFCQNVEFPITPGNYIVLEEGYPIHEQYNAEQIDTYFQAIETGSDV